ncbi:MAG: tRNA 2-thiouridine(34) synthase MnmA [Patescibacteria group bacterium]|jgi:tRNA-specific 2-thiouridylase
MKIAVAMSGGVDSSVVAKMLKDEGHELVGLFLKLWSDPMCNVVKENRCCNYEALEDARKVAHGLGIPFYVINAVDEFKKDVVDYFIDEYKKLKTPNPCIVCNEKIKFDLLLKKALSIGCDYLATGHYARIQKLPVASYQLLAGIDGTKDQSYMLYRLNQNQLSKTLFPLGEMKKKDVRELAKKWDLPVKEKPESQEICFFGDRDYRFFLKRYLDQKYFKPGEIADKEGNVLGTHEGLVNYTIGQRKGIDQLQSASCQLKTQKKPLYVVGFNVSKNQLIVGDDEDIYSKEMTVTDLNWLIEPQNLRAEELMSLKVKIRYRHAAVPCEIKGQISKIKNIVVEFDEPQRAITPGQSAVFYLGDEVLGGGYIK